MSLTGQNVQNLVLASVAAGGPGSAVSYQLGPQQAGVVVVTSTAALATFTVEGRITPTAAWVSLHGAASILLAGGAGTVLLAIPITMHEMRLQWTGNAGAVTAWLKA